MAPSPGADAGVCSSSIEGLSPVPLSSEKSSYDRPALNTRPRHRVRLHVASDVRLLHPEVAAFLGSVHADAVERDLRGVAPPGARVQIESSIRVAPGISADLERACSFLWSTGP